MVAAPHTPEERRAFVIFFVIYLIVLIPLTHWRKIALARRRRQLEELERAELGGLLPDTAADLGALQLAEEGRQGDRGADAVLREDGEQLPSYQAAGKDVVVRVPEREPSPSPASESDRMLPPEYEV